MNNEEKKAVDKIKTLIQYLNIWKENFTMVPDDVKYLVAILNLIEKQQKEIEDKKEEIYAIAKTNYDVGMLEERSQWYKKINEKIEKIKKETWYISDGYEAKQSCIEELEELIGKEE